MWDTPIQTLLMLQSSLSIVLHNWYLFLYLLLVPSAFVVITESFFSNILVDQISLTILSYMGGILGFSLISLGIVLLKIKPSPALGIVVAFIASLVLIYRKQHLHILASPNLIGLALFSLFILLLRLVFTQDLIVPPYADSIEHLQIVRDFLNPELPPRAFYRISLDLGHYYHFGFHALAAWLSSVTNTTPEQTILLLGQYFQTLAVLSMYPLAQIITKNSFSAWTVMSIAGLLLPVPAYASNWGKYPAIASLTGISFVLTLMVIYIKNKPVISKKFWWLFGFAVITTISLHSRSIFVFFLAAFSASLYLKSNTIKKNFWLNESNINYATILAPILIILLYMYTILLKIPVSTLSLFLFIGLTIFAISNNFISTSSVILFVLIMGASLLFPLPVQFSSYKINTIFDRPYLVIFFYIPASFLFWSGLEGFVQLYTSQKFRFWRQYLLMGVLTAGIANTFFIQDHQPSGCCVFINDDDLFAFEWMKQNLPQGTIVGIAATGKPGNFLPSDGGAWIEPIIGIPTRKLDSKANFIVETRKLCNDGIIYFYIDNLENSFDEYNLIEAGGVYLFGLGNVRIYQLECDF